MMQSRHSRLEAEPAKKRLKVAIISQYFSGRLPQSVARELKSRGHEVKVLTTYSRNSRVHMWGTSRRLLSADDSFHGIQVRRVPSITKHSRNPIGRIAHYISFAFSARLANKYIQDVDVVYVHGTPATVAEPARALSRSHDVPFVYHVQDIWPESVTESNFLPQPVLNTMRRGINWWLSSVYKAASAVIAIAPTAQALLVERGAPAEHTHLVYNWADVGEVIQRTPKNGLSLLYAGSLGDFQDLDTIIHAAKSFANLPDFHLKIAGSGIAEERLKSLVSSLGLHKTVEFLGKVKPEDMPKLYAEADFQIVSLKNLGFFSGTIPSKLQVGLAHGVPVITTVKGDVSRIVSEHGLGLIAEPEDSESVVAAMRAAYNMSAADASAYSGRALRFFTESFTKETAMDKIENILLKAAASGRN